MVLCSYNIVNLYMYVFSATIFYEIIFKLRQIIFFKHVITYSYDHFGIFRVPKSNYLDTNFLEGTN